jgi:hypothetical protein
LESSVQRENGDIIDCPSATGFEVTKHYLFVPGNYLFG